VFFNEPAVFQSIAKHNMQHGVQQREIRAGAERKHEIRIARDGSQARIGDNQFSAVIAASPDVIGRDRRAFADIRAGNEQYLRLRNFAPWNEAAINIEGELVSYAGRNHAEAAILIDVPRAQRDARKLTHQIRLLGGKRCAAEDGDGVLSVFFLDFAQAASGEVERFVPTRFPEARIRAEERVEEPVGMVRLQITLHAFWAKHAAVERKLFPGLEADHAVFAHLELNAALLAAEAAVGLDQSIGQM